MDCVQSVPFERRCNRCGVVKPIGAFPCSRAAGSGGHGNECRDCRKPPRKPSTYKTCGDKERAAALVYYHANRAICRARQAVYRAAHLEEIRRQQREYASAHREERSARNREWREANPEHCRDYYHRKRARRREVFVAAVSIESIYARDRGRCQICDGRVKWETAYPDPNSKSIDHIIPLSEPGATHEPRNCQLAHLRCNVSRGAGRVSAQLRLVD